jgi:hypothetical protein
LGDSTDAGTAEIHWPSGAIETVKLPAVDRIFAVTEGKGITGVSCGMDSCPIEPSHSADFKSTAKKP